ncbi:SgcJ/EcaC family oxidoreductase [Streptomyces sp. NPDC050636]|uniref:SgcJ/EcaC family oxidoreductase n=1 Tax=Streptomyces sp. NPDC050636 TaxID=3154510 RepID=UPI0034313DC5
MNRSLCARAVPIAAVLALTSLSGTVLTGAAPSFAQQVGSVGSIRGNTRVAKQVEAPTEKEIAALFKLWNAALATGDPEAVADRYTPDAVLLPTQSGKVRAGRAEIVDYFGHFLRYKPVGKILESHITVLDDENAIDSGIYEFTLTDEATHQLSTVLARYSFTYQLRSGEWKIVNHHSSVVPEGRLAPFHDRLLQ